VRPATYFVDDTVDEIIKDGAGDVYEGPKSFTLQLEHASITVDGFADGASVPLTGKEANVDVGLQ